MHIVQSQHPSDLSAKNRFGPGTGYGDMRLRSRHEKLSWAFGYIRCKEALLVVDLWKKISGKTKVTLKTKATF
jgi:hypothetical protein